MRCTLCCSLLLFLIFTFENMLGNALKTLGTHWEVKETLLKHHEDFWGTLVRTF